MISQGCAAGVRRIKFCFSTLACLEPLEVFLTATYSDVVFGEWWPDGCFGEGVLTHRSERERRKEAMLSFHALAPSTKHREMIKLVRQVTLAECIPSPGDLRTTRSCWKCRTRTASPSQTRTGLRGSRSSRNSRSLESPSIASTTTTS